MGNRETLLHADPHGLDAVIDAVSGLADQLTAMRTEMHRDLSDLHSELRAVREGDVMGLRMQVKGIWATLGVLIGGLLTFALSHLK